MVTSTIASEIESERSNCFSRIILEILFTEITTPVISVLSVKLHDLENSRGLNCQFDISSCVRALIALLLVFSRI